MDTKDLLLTLGLLCGCHTLPVDGGTICTESYMLNKSVKWGVDYWNLAGAELNMQFGSCSDATVNIQMVHDIVTGANAMTWPEGRVGKLPHIDVDAKWAELADTNKVRLLDITLAHEIGHALGFAHDETVHPPFGGPDVLQPDGVSVMYPTDFWLPDAQVPLWADVVKVARLHGLEISVIPDAK